MNDTTTTTDGDELVVEPPGPLPEFEGRIPIAVQTDIQGASERITRAMHLDERLVIVVEVRVTDVRHPMTKDGVKRKHVLKVEDAYELPGRRGQRLLTMLKKAWRLGNDAEGPVLAGFDVAEGAADGIPVTTDGSGVVVTPGDAADYGLDDESNDPVVVVLYGGRRTLWPDDYPVGMARPVLGAMVAEPDSDDDAQVVELLDHVTGESLGTWSDADEEARLLAEEQRLAAIEDVEAGQVLTDGQRVNRQPWPGFDDMSAKDVISKLTTEVVEVEVAANVYLYEEAHKARAGVLRTARARRDVLWLRAEEQRLARDDAAMAAADLPPLPDDGEVDA